MLRMRALFLGGYAVACGRLGLQRSASSSAFNNERRRRAPSSGSGSGRGAAAAGAAAVEGGGPGLRRPRHSTRTSGRSKAPRTSVTVKTTIYANTDDSLYSMDPTTNAVTLIGTFAGRGRLEHRQHRDRRGRERRGRRVREHRVGHLQGDPPHDAAGDRVPHESGDDLVRLVDRALLRARLRPRRRAWSPNEMLVGGDGSGQPLVDRPEERRRDRASATSAPTRRTRGTTLPSSATSSSTR